MIEDCLCWRFFLCFRAFRIAFASVGVGTVLSRLIVGPIQQPQDQAMILESGWLVPSLFWILLMMASERLASAICHCVRNLPVWLLLENLEVSEAIDNDADC